MQIMQGWHVGVKIEIYTARFAGERTGTFTMSLSACSSQRIWEVFAESVARGRHAPAAVLPPSSILPNGPAYDCLL